MDPELHTEKVVTNNKLFLIDLKKNQAGYYLKVSEISNQKKSSIFIPQEGISGIIDALCKISAIMDKENA
ncbi:MAG: DNA-binding protein [Spirochaetia bacterium]|nr:DNA-binding protein [Spirochaetia bacterium]